MYKLELVEKFFENNNQLQDILGLLGLTETQTNTLRKSRTLPEECRKEIEEKIRKVDQNLLIEKMFATNNQLQGVMGLVESAQAGKPKPSSVSRAKGKAKGKTPKNETLKELFEANNQLQDMLGHLKLAQNKR